MALQVFFYWQSFVGFKGDSSNMRLLSRFTVNAYLFGVISQQFYLYWYSSELN
jgi:hypothetical protein